MLLEEDKKYSFVKEEFLGGINTIDETLSLKLCGGRCREFKKALKDTQDLLNELVEDFPMPQDPENKKDNNIEDL